MSIFPKRIYRCPISIWKYIQHHKSSGKCRSKPQWDITSYQSEWLLSKRNNKCWGECGEKGTLMNCWWECKLMQVLWKTICKLIKKLKIELMYSSAISVLGIYPKKIKTLIWKCICTPMFTVPLFTVVKI